MADPTDLSYAISEAQALGDRPETTPWLPPALSVDRPLTLAGLLAEADANRGHAVLLGKIDRPARQEQLVLAVDLSDGGVAILGGLGAGKTTALATIARSFLSTFSSGFLIAFDGGGGALLELFRGRDENSLIRSARAFGSDDPATLTLTIEQLEGELLRRRAGDAANHPILVVIDGFEQFKTLFSMGREQAWIGRLERVLSVGRHFGIFAAYSATRLSEVLLEWRGLAKATIVLGPAADGPEGGRLPSRQPGLGVDRSGDAIQIADPTGMLSATVGGPIATVFGDLPFPLTRPATSVARISEDSVWVPIGAETVSGDELEVELGWRHLLVVGPPRSGKSLLAREIAKRVHEVTGEQAILFTGKRARPADQRALRSVDHSIVGELAIGQSLGDPTRQRKFTEQVLESMGVRPGLRPLVIADDANVLARDRDMRSFLQYLVEYDCANLVVASDIGNVSQWDWPELKNHSGQVAFLRPTETTDNDDGTRVIADALTIRRGFSFTEGGGVLYDRRSQTQFQAYTPDGEGA